jgi:hypothetical protein
MPFSGSIRSSDKLFRLFAARLKSASRNRLHKIGYTQGDPQRRIDQLNDDELCGLVYWPYNFELVTYYEVHNCASVEREAHKALQGKRVAGEIFFITEQEARTTVNGLIRR